MTAARTAIAVLEEAFAPLEGRHILDIGCGQGALGRALLKLGARVTGVDPSAPAIAAAREAAPGAAFEVADAADLPFPSAAFDGAVFLNSLHHVPVRSMSQALREAARVSGHGRPVVVVEPLAEGSFFEVVRTVEDETEVRREASAAVAGLVEAGRFELLAEETFTRHERFRSLDELCERLVSVDPARKAVIATERPAIEAAFHRLAIGEAGGYGFDQPMRAVTLRVRS
jgi:SAM-dependent methyltransferase